MPRTANLPSWAKAICPGKIEIDADLMYREILTELEVPLEPSTSKDSDQKTGIDQYWLAVSYTISKLDIQFAVAGTELAPPQGGALVIIVKDNTKGEERPSSWAMSEFPEGSGADLATKGKQAREIYKELRNLPI